MDDLQARHIALEMAIKEAPAGAPWAAVIKNANTFATFIIQGTVPEGEAK